MRHTTRFVPLAVIFTAFVGLSATLRSDDPVSSSVTFNREVVRIFQRKCLPCHEPGAVAIPLATYRQARPWARAIREELIEQRMPPWPAAPGFGTFANDIGLTERELRMILMWTDGGVPRGDDRDLPGRGLESAGTGAEADRRPDRTLELPLQRIPAGEEHVVRRITIDPGLGEDRWLGELAIVPGNRRVLRAAFVWVVDAAGSKVRWVAGWTPWLHAVAPPRDSAFLVPAGARLAAELHYRGREAELEDRSSIALFFAPGGSAVASQVVVETVPAPDARGSLARRRGSATLREDSDVWAILPSTAGTAPRRASSLEVSARRPDGTIDVLLWIPDGRYDWPTPYILKSPAPLPAGTAIVVTEAYPRGFGSVPPTSVTVGTVRPRATTSMQ